MDSNSKFSVQVEIWQSQNYWPLKGWTIPISGAVHFASVLLPTYGTETFPDDMNPPPGWQWIDRWSIDTSPRFGQPDNDGWYYGVSFERLNDNIKHSTAAGTTNATSIVRKRRWIRNMLCTSAEVIENIKKRIEQIHQYRSNIEASLLDKENTHKALKFYEENRSFVFAQSLNLATHGTVNTLTFLRELINKLKVLKQYLYERASMEKDYALKLELVGKKYAQIIDSIYNPPPTLPKPLYIPPAPTQSTRSSRSSSPTPVNSSYSNNTNGENISTSSTVTITNQRNVEIVDFQSPSAEDYDGTSPPTSTIIERSSSSPTTTTTTAAAATTPVKETTVEASIAMLEEDISRSEKKLKAAVQEKQNNPEEYTGILKVTSVFFNKLLTTSDILSTNKHIYTANILQDMTDEINQMLTEVTTIYKDARSLFQKNNDICHLSEAAIKNFLASVRAAYESSRYSSLKEITDLSNELSAIRGAVPYNPIIFQKFQPSHLNGSGIISFHMSPENSSNDLLSTPMHSNQSNTPQNTPNVSNTPVPGTASAASTPMLTRGSQSLSAAAGGFFGASVEMYDMITPVKNSKDTKSLSRQQQNSRSSFATPSSHTAQSIIAIESREDVWLSVQRYKRAVRDSQEALCVLIAEAMDKELEQHIITNRVHVLCYEIIKSYCHEEILLAQECMNQWKMMFVGLAQSITEIGLPHPVLLSPFAKFSSSASSASSAATRQTENPAMITNSGSSSSASSSHEQDYDDFINSVGIFSFTSLFKESLPANPNIVKSKQLKYMKIVDFQHCLQDHHDPIAVAVDENEGGIVAVDMEQNLVNERKYWHEDIWNTATFIATSDGYLHIITKQKCDIPDRSFFMKQCEIVEIKSDKFLQFGTSTSASSPKKGLDDITEAITTTSEQSIETTTTSPSMIELIPAFYVLEIRMIIQQSMQQNVRRSITTVTDGIYLRFPTFDECQEWLSDLKSLTSLVIHTDPEINQAAQEAMLASLPILKGETAKIDLELKKYEDLQLSEQLETSQADIIHQNNQLQTSDSRDSPVDNTISNTSLELEGEGEGEEEEEDNANTTTRHQSSSKILRALQDQDSDDEEIVSALEDTIIDGERERLTPIVNASARSRVSSSATTTTTASSSKKTSNSSASSMKQLPVKPLTPPVGKHYVPSQHKKVGSSWVKSTDDNNNQPMNTLGNSPFASRTIINTGTTPVVEPMKPKKLIPTVDPTVPLATRHSSLISQYEQGLKKQKELSTMRVQQSKGRYFSRGLLQVLFLYALFSLFIENVLLINSNNRKEKVGRKL